MTRHRRLALERSRMAEGGAVVRESRSTVTMEDGYAQSLLAVAGAPPPLLQGDSGVGRAQ